jgi:hypothetical protein
LPPAAAPWHQIKIQEAFSMPFPKRARALVVSPLVGLCALTLFGPVACRTGGGDVAPADDAAVVESSEAESAAPSPESRTSDGGYFVTVPAQSTNPSVVALYDKLYDAIDALSRRRAREAGELESYVEDFDASGYTSLVSDDEEIECDRERCALKLTGRTVSGAKGLPADLTAALDLVGVVPTVRGSGEKIQKTYALGDSERLGLACIQGGYGHKAVYRCDFNLDGAALGSARPPGDSTPSERGRLTSCVLAPGTSRSAEEARDVLEGGALLPLTAGAAASTKTVGYLRYTRQGKEVELVDFYLCGDVSHDNPQISGRARSPKSWAVRAAPAPSRLEVEPAHQDDAEMRMTATVVETTKTAYVLEVRFKLAPENDGVNAAEVYGEDRFFMRFERGWID